MSKSPQTPRLGALLVERGLLTPEQLRAALAEQERTGTPLGQVLVQRGTIPPAVVAQALATQRGGVAKSEFGMAVGFGTALPPPPRALPPVTVEPPSTRELQAELRAAEQRLEAMAEQMVHAARTIAELEVERNEALKRVAMLEGLPRRVA